MSELLKLTSHTSQAHDRFKEYHSDALIESDSYKLHIAWVKIYDLNRQIPLGLVRMDLIGGYKYGYNNI